MASLPIAKLRIISFRRYRLAKKVKLFGSSMGQGTEKGEGDLRLSGASPSPVGGGYLLSHSRSTIGVAGLNFSVRDGKRWNPRAIAAFVRLSARGNAPTRPREEGARRRGRDGRGHRQGTREQRLLARIRVHTPPTCAAVVALCSATRYSSGTRAGDRTRKALG